MKITKRRLRRIIIEACGLGDAPHDEMPADQTVALHEPSTAVPMPQDYEAVRSFMGDNPDIVDLGINMVMELVGVSCERSTAQAIIDHLQDMLHGLSGDEFSFTDDVAELPEDPAMNLGRLEAIGAL